MTNRFPAKVTLSKERMYDVIRAPVITEKSTMGSEHGKVTFKVALDATKTEIKPQAERVVLVFDPHPKPGQRAIRHVHVCPQHKSAVERYMDDHAAQDRECMANLEMLLIYKFITMAQVQ